MSEINEASLEDLTITLELEDDTVLECAVLARFPLNNRQYIALQPMTDNHDEEGIIYLYRFSEDADGEPILDMIESEEEFEAVEERFDEILDEAEYDEFVEEKEE